MKTAPVAILNRTTQVNPDGNWVLPNIPANFGYVRARATCVQNGVTVFGQSDLFLPPKNRGVDVPKITLGPTTPIPNSLTLTASKTTLTTAGATTQVTVTASYNGATAQNVTPASTGTQYLISNPDIATVSGDGLITAHRSGMAIVQVVNEGTQGLLSFQVLLTADSDGDGIPDDAEIAMGLDPNDPTDALLDAEFVLSV